MDQNFWQAVGEVLSYYKHNKNVDKNVFIQLPFTFRMLKRSEKYNKDKDFKAMVDKFVEDIMPQFKEFVEKTKNGEFGSDKSIDKFIEISNNVIKEFGLGPIQDVKFMDQDEMLDKINELESVPNKTEVQENQLNKLKTLINASAK
jgi:hypothetical protein